MRRGRRHGRRPRGRGAVRRPARLPRPSRPGGDRAPPDRIRPVAGVRLGSSSGACAKPGSAGSASSAPGATWSRRIPGREEGTVVVGAHYDTKDAFPASWAPTTAPRASRSCSSSRAPCRDRSTGRRSTSCSSTPRRPARAPSFESGGHRGSAQYVRYAEQGGRQGSPPLAEHSRDGPLRHGRRLRPRDPAARRNSDAAPVRRLRGVPPGAVRARHSAVRRRASSTTTRRSSRPGVPAVDLIDFGYGPGPSPGAWWHTREDDRSHVCAREPRGRSEPRRSPPCPSCAR